MDLIGLKSLLLIALFLNKQSFRGITGCKEWERAIMNVIARVAHREGITRSMPRDPTFCVSLQGDANGHPVFHPDYAALGFGPHHHSGGL